jgi:hypothetical protein
VVIPHDELSPTFGLPGCLRVPVAAASIAALTTFVGDVHGSIQDTKGATVAIKVRAHNRGFPQQPAASLWRTEFGRAYADILFPEFQFWVHVDYRGYRAAYRRLGMPAISSETFLDHIQNRRAMRLRWYSHPFLRLGLISRKTNTNSGHATGAEGIEVEYLKTLLACPEKTRALRARISAYQVKYADVADLTKMLDIAPGTFIVNGVRDSLHLFDP